MMRRPLIAGNWKMHHDSVSTERVLRDITTAFQGSSDIDVLICPSFVSLSLASLLLKNSSISLGAQTMSEHVQGAFTGEISGAMLRSVGCEYVILGHSERRTLFFETDQIINQKLKAAQAIALTPILCVGESLDERESGHALAVIRNQLSACLADFSPTLPLVVAYEPIWAIGTGKVASSAQAQDVHAFIRSELASLGFSADSIRILYGGSVKGDNTEELLSMADIDGALVGGASLESRSFVDILTKANLLVKGTKGV